MHLIDHIPNQKAIRFPQYIIKIVLQYHQAILKKHHPSLKAVVSIGGWGAGYFSEVAADLALLSVFVESTMDLV
jgi:GH18 family chitinase